MTDYSFRTLNDKEFESLANDLCSKEFGTHIERFKPGPDDGIDGRFFTDSNKAIIIQSKHWLKSGVAKLINELKKKELPKIIKINPARYILFTSLPLSPANKKAIFSIFSNYMKNEGDVWGNNDINALLQKYPDVEKSNFKLWLSSASVIENILNKSIIIKSSYVINEAAEENKRYVYTDNHYKSIQKLEKLHTLIITGEPGIGKTTLAKQICLEYFSNKYEFICISDSIDEAYNLISDDKNQIFYFDDFLGSNFLTALTNNTDSKIVQFINIARKKSNIRFVLTSRTSIWNQGKHLGNKFRTSNIDNNEYQINIDSFSKYEKAQVLYNRIWHTDLKNEYIDEIYAEDRYKEIISHRNFNPRIIEFITDADRAIKISPSSYWNYILNALENPQDVWDHPYTTQLDNPKRAILLIVAYNWKSIDQETLEKSFNALPNDLSQPAPGNIDTTLCHHIKILTKSFLNRHIDDNNTMYTLSNPSLGDYIFANHNAKELVITIVDSIRTTRSIFLIASKWTKTIELKTVAFELLDRISAETVKQYNISYFFSLVSSMISNDLDISTYNKFILDQIEALDFVSNDLEDSILETILYLSQYGIFISDRIYDEILNYILLEDISRESLSIFINIYENYPHIQSRESYNALAERAQALIESDIYDIIQENSLLENATIEYDHEDRYGGIDIDRFDLKLSIKSVISNEITEMGFSPYDIDMDQIIINIDIDSLIEDELNARHRPNEDYGRGHTSQNHLDMAAIIDLFERT